MVRLKDIAEQTGLTVATVSKALNDSPEISEATTRLVREAAHEMGYRPKKEKRGRTKSIGVLLPEVRSHYYAELMHSLYKEIERYGYTMIASLCDFSSEGIETYYDRLRKHNFSGLFIAGGVELNHNLCDKIVHSGLPTVMFTEYDVPYPIDTIYSKTEMVLRLALEHLIDLGHKKIGYIGEYNSDVRFLALQALVEQYDVEMAPRHIKNGPERFELGGYLRACELLEGELPTAIITSYDQIAIGALRAFREKGVRVPEDISIVGIDNAIIDEYFPIPLTSVMTPVNQMGVVAVKILMDNIHNPEGHVVQNVALQSKLVVRGSTCSPRQSG